MSLEIVNPVDAPTPRQLELLQAVGRFRARRCYSPTLAELAGELGISRSTVFEHISQLQKKRLIHTRPGRARSLKLTEKAHKVLSRFGRPCANSPLCPDPGIALVGKVAAGQPVEAVEDNRQLSLRSYFAPAEDTFALEVSGDSMIDEDIRSGDYVICRRQAVAQNGQLVVALVDGRQATLKRFYRERQHVRLQPANADYQPIHSKNCRITAVAIGLVRKL